MTSLFEIQGTQLVAVPRKKLANEQMLEEWIAKDPRLIGLDILVLARQVITESGGRIDILGIDREGDLAIVELKRDRTPRDIVAQVLDYASWVRGLTTKQVHQIAAENLHGPLGELFKQAFGMDLPDRLNESHSMVIVASDFDASSERIVTYLNEEHGVSINAAFFNVFEHDGKILLSTNWLMEQAEVAQRSESRTKAPWGGLWYANVGDRPWEALRSCGFLSAGGGRFYSNQLRSLQPGANLYAYKKGKGYVGYGEVTTEVVPAKQFEVNGVPLLQLVKHPKFDQHRDDPDRAEYVVGVRWLKTFPVEHAKTFHGIFTNPSVVCKLRDTKTIEFLKQQFEQENQQPIA